MRIRFEESDGKKRFFINDEMYERIEDVPQEFQHYFEDKNGNGMPDHFDAVNPFAPGASPKELIASLFSNKQSQTEPPQKKRQDEVRDFNTGRERSILPTLIKLSLVIFVGLVLFYAFLYIKEISPSGELQAEPSDVSDSTNASAIESAIETEKVVKPLATQLILVIEDPNEPPYGMFIGAYLDKKLQFTLDVPDGEFIDSPDTLLQFQMPAPEGTNLSEELFSISTSAGECSTSNPLNAQPEDVVSITTVNVGNVIFLKTESGSGGAGQTYVTHAYAFDHSGYCTTFAIELHSGETGAYETEVSAYDEVAEIQRMEALLKTIKIKND